jgi:hypothetical protein
MATIPPVSSSQNSPSKASPADWILEVHPPESDGKAAQHNLPSDSGHAHTLVVQSGVQFKLSPAVTPFKDQSPPLALVGSVSHAKKGLDLQLMLPGGGSLVLLDFYAANAKAAPTKLQVTQLDGKEESVFSSLPKEAPATAEASVQGGDSKSSASPASSAVEPLPADQAALKAVKDGGKSKSKGKKITDDDSSWLGGFDGSWLGLLALGGLGGGGGGGSSGAGAGTGTGTGTGTTVSNVVSGSFTAGPALAGNGLSVQIYDLAGNLLGSAKLSDEGDFEVNIGSYSGAVIAKVVDTGVGADFMDEATALGKDLNAVFMAVAVIDGSSNKFTVNINPITTIAAIKVGFNPADGSGTVSGTNLAEKLAVIEEANLAVAKIFGMTELLTQAKVVSTINRDGTANASANVMGKMLAALSGADKNNAGDMAGTLTAISAGIVGKGSAASLDASAQSTLLAGAVNANTHFERRGRDQERHNRRLCGNL